MVSPDNHLYEFKPFALDAANRTLFKDNEIVHLTPKAVETLLVLVQHRVQVVDKEQLLKEVWPDTFVEEGSLSRNIHELRKALGDDTSTKLHRNHTQAWLQVPSSVESISCRDRALRRPHWWGNDDGHRETHVCPGPK